MDALITTIVAGVVVAVIGAFAAYYFGVRQERLKQAYEREREARRRQEEQQEEQQRREEEWQKELNRRSAEALADIQNRVSSFISAFGDWCDRANTLSDIQPAEDDIKIYGSAEKAWRPYVEEEMRLFEQLSEVENEMASLRDRYQAYESSLKPSTRSLFHSFENEVIIPFTVALGDESTRGTVASLEKLMRKLDEVEERRKGTSGRLFSFLFLPDAKKIDAAFREMAQEIDTEFAELLQEVQRNWEDLEAYRTAFYNETAKYVG